jgi:hypothetical protein
LLLAAAAPASGSAEQSDPPARTAKSSQGATPAQKPAKPAPRAAASPNTRAAAAQKQEWTLEHAMPDHSASMRQYDSPPPKIGRVPLQSGPGTVGFETETRSNAYQTPDGRTIPGLQSTENRASSYLGLSLSVPTSDKTMSFPVPLVPPWGRP